MIIMTRCLNAEPIRFARTKIASVRAVDRCEADATAYDHRLRNTMAA
ncbi:MAG: hypothetical protein WCF20_03960 [Methylovirgula sp.]